MQEFMQSNVFIVLSLFGSIASLIQLIKDIKNGEVKIIWIFILVLCLVFFAYSFEVKQTITEFDKSNKLTIQYIKDYEETVTYGEEYLLPSTVTAVMSDSSEVIKHVTWDTQFVDTHNLGIKVVYGTVPDYKSKVKLTITVTPKKMTMDPFSATYGEKASKNIELGGNRYAYGYVFQIANSSTNFLSFNLERKYNRINALIGVQPGYIPESKHYIRFYGDGEPLGEQIEISDSSPPIPLSLDVRGVSNLKVEGDSETAYANCAIVEPTLE